MLHTIRMPLSNTLGLSNLPIFMPPSPASPGFNFTITSAGTSASPSPANHGPMLPTIRARSHRSISTPPSFTFEGCQSNSNSNSGASGAGFMLRGRPWLLPSNAGTSRGMVAVSTTNSSTKQRSGTQASQQQNTSSVCRQFSPACFVEPDLTSIASFTPPPADHTAAVRRRATTGACRTPRLRLRIIAVQDRRRRCASRPGSVLGFLLKSTGRSCILYMYLPLITCHLEHEVLLEHDPPSRCCDLKM